MSLQPPPATSLGQTSDETPPKVPQPQRSGIWPVISVLSVVLLVVGSVAGYRWWEQRRTGQFKSGCVEATRNQQWERLGAIAEKWLEWNPRSDDAHVYLAEAQFQAGDLAEAAESLGRVSDDYHGALSALSFRGEILYGDLHRPYEAEATWQRLLTIDPRMTHAHQRLISFYALSLQRDKMVSQIRRSLELRSEPPEAYSYLVLANALGFTEGLALVRKWRKSHPDDETFEVAEAIYAAKYQKDATIADAFEASGFTAGDQIAINSCLEKYPQNIEVLAYHLEQAIFYGRTSEVIGLLKAAPAEALRDGRFWQYRAWLSKQAEDYQQAIQSLEKAVELDPFSWRARWELATVLRLKGQADAARHMQALAMEGKSLEDTLFVTDGRALNWGAVEKMRHYVSQVNQPEVLAALDARIRDQGGQHVAEELIGPNLPPSEIHADDHPPRLSGPSSAE